MHVLIPFAAPSGPACRAALRQLALPHLQALLAQLEAEPPMACEASSYTAPHERVHARCLGLPLADGSWPLAALTARAAGLIAPEQPVSDWGLLSLCHWQVGLHDLSLHEPLPPDAASAQALGQAMAGYFQEDGLCLHPQAPGRWWLQGEALRGLRSASPDRVMGRGDARDFMPQGPGSARLQRLQSEMQMLLYTHPVNEARSARGLAPLNGFWISGTGELPAASALADSSALQQVTDLRDAALQDDAPRWCQAWQALDAHTLAPCLQAAQRGAAVQLSLCSERASQTWHQGARPGSLRSWWRRRRAPTASACLEAL